MGVKLRWTGTPKRIRMQTSRLVVAGDPSRDCVMVSDEEAAELLATYPEFVNPDAEPEKRIREPRAGEPIRPGWERAEAVPDNDEAPPPVED